MEWRYAFYFTASGIRDVGGDHFDCGGEVWGMVPGIFATGDGLQ
jgi:hypothetical protein